MCFHIAKHFYFCGHPSFEVTAQDAIFIVDGHDKDVCKSYTFYPCHKTQETGVYCIPWQGKTELYRLQIEAHPDTIIIVSLGDCNLGRRTVMGGCRQVPRRLLAMLDLKWAPVPEDLVRDVKRGAEDEMDRLIWSRERNYQLMAELEEKLRVPTPPSSRP